MGKHNNYPGIDPEITRIIAIEAVKVTLKLGFTESFIQDVEQDLHITVSSALPNLQEAIFEKSVQQIVKNRATDIIRWHRRERRARRHEAFSMNENYLEVDDLGEDIAQVMDLELLRRSFFGLVPEWYKHRDEAADFAESLARLPEDLRKLADSLEASGGNLVQAATAFGVSYKKARIMHARLRRALKLLWKDEK